MGNVKKKLASLTSNIQIEKDHTAFVVNKKSVKRGTELRTALTESGKAKVKYLGGPLSGKAKVTVFD